MNYYILFIIIIIIGLLFNHSYAFDRTAQNPQVISIAPDGTFWLSDFDGYGCEKDKIYHLERDGTIIDILNAEN